MSCPEQKAFIHKLHAVEVLTFTFLVLILCHPKQFSLLLG
uniref:Uncharacterized protein n=1 Tax=Rhizophora mucronata TaxID=61149 RepID=A0A2P2LB44_RHIMU